MESPRTVDPRAPALRDSGYWVLQNCEKPELLGPVACPSPPSSLASAAIQFTPALDAKW